MTKTQVLKELKKLGSDRTKSVYKNHGAEGELFGVKMGALKELKKKVKQDHKLALQLWDTGNIDARNFATLIADPAAFSKSELDKWAADSGFYWVSDNFSSNIAYKSEHALSRMEKWIKSRKEFVKRSGFSLLSLFARKDKNSISDAGYREYIDLITAQINKAPNRAKETMNNALICIGLRSPALKKAALDAARKIGTVEIDHGDTECKTNDAVAYLDRKKVNYWKLK